MRKKFGFTFRNKARVWQLIGGLALVIMGLGLSLQPLVQASDEPGELLNASSVRPEVSDMAMFGKKLSVNRMLPSLSMASLQPTTDPIMPTRLRIPALAIDTNVEQVGLHNGNMDVPNNIWNAGWLTISPKPGEVGNAVLDGHKDSVRGTAVFWSLGSLKAGDKIYVSDFKGDELTFEVTEVQSYTQATAPLDRIFGPSDEKHLNLITCDGTFIRDQHTYDKRLVVYTKLV